MTEGHKNTKLLRKNKRETEEQKDIKKDKFLGKYVNGMFLCQFISK